MRRLPTDEAVPNKHRIWQSALKALMALCLLADSNSCLAQSLTGPSSSTPNTVQKVSERPSTLSEKSIADVKPEDENLFRYQDWKSGGGIGRLAMFNRLLKQYNLIGMNQDKVLELLGCGGSGPLGGPGIEYIGYSGDVKTLNYWLDSEGCTGPNLRICVHLQKGRVTSWNFASRSGKESPPITTNVIIPRTGTGSSLLFGGAFAQASWRTEGGWPETVAK